MADERKRRRMESNRESARRSRVKKQQQLQQVISNIDHYKRQNIQIGNKIHETKQHCSVLEAEIETVTAMKIDLEQRLCQLNSILDEIEEMPRIWRVGSWCSDDLKVGCGDGLGGYWMDGLGIIDWLGASSSTATLSRT